MQKEDLCILMLEDDPMDAELNKIQLLLLEEYNCIIRWVTNRRDFLDALDNFAPHLILSDYNLPDYSGLEALQDAKRQNPTIPFIFVTGAIDEETAVGTIKAGAWDYVVKDRLFRLTIAIRSTLQLEKERLNALRIAEQNRQLSMAIEQSASHVLITDTEGRIEYVNARFIDVTGYSFDEIKGKKASILKSGMHSPEFYTNLWASLKSGSTWRGEFLNKKKDGTLFWEFASISPMKNEHGKTTHFIAVKEDITERKEIENKLIEAKDQAERSDRLKTSFLQNMSHEIRTPLNAIMGFSSLLSERETAAAEQKEYINIINTNSKQLLSIVEDILTIARIETGHTDVRETCVSLNDLIDDLFSIFEPQAIQKQIGFKSHKALPKRDYQVMTDLTKLTQILTNLLNNAFKFTNQGLIEFGYEVKNNTLEFYVNDTGIGIDPEMQAMIFERFVQVDGSTHRVYGGTGLGLSICKSFVELLGGRIWVKSDPTTGSQFIFTITYKPVYQKIEEEKMQTQSFHGGWKTILVAEDEEFNFILLQQLLEEQQLNILRARNGKEAVDLCLENSSIELVLMDIRMPVMDGQTAFFEIKKTRPDLPIIALTAYSLEQEKSQFLNAGFDDHIPKPFKKEMLYQKIDALLSR